MTRVVSKVTSKTRGTMIAMLPKTGEGNTIELSCLHSCKTVKLIKKE